MTPDQHVGSTIAWAFANWKSVAITLGMVVVSAKLLIKALEGLIAILLPVLPWLKTTDGELKGIIAILDRISKSPILNAIALSPRVAFNSSLNPPGRDVASLVPPVKGPLVPISSALRVIAFGLFLCAASLARAGEPAIDVPPAAAVQAGASGPVISHGPTIPLTQIRFANPVTGNGNPQLGLLGAGAGYQINAGFAQTAIGGLQWDLFDVSVMGFATFGVSQPFQAASLALGIGTLNNLLTLGFGSDMVAISNGTQISGLFSGHENSGNLFLTLNFGINLGPQPQAPPTGVVSGPLGLKRGNTLSLF